jgi:heat shock protein HslJ
MKYLLFVLPFLLAMKCETADLPSKKSKLVGEWFVQEVFLGDVIDTPCGHDVKDAPQLTVNFSGTADLEGQFSFTGKSAINTFFGTYGIISLDEPNGQGTMKFGSIGATKMAGSEELMACESRFFSILERATDFSVSNENGKEVLRIGAFKKDDKPSRDGGTFLIMERL